MKIFISANVFGISLVKKISALQELISVYMKPFEKYIQNLCKRCKMARVTRSTSYPNKLNESTAGEV